MPKNGSMLKTAKKRLISVGLFTRKHEEISFSPVHHLLELNDDLSESDKLLIQDTICIIELEIEILGEQILSAQKANRYSVIKRRNALLLYTRAHRYRISPLRRIPLEIMQEIFLLTALHQFKNARYPPDYRSPRLTCREMEYVHIFGSVRSVQAFRQVRGRMLSLSSLNLSIFLTGRKEDEPLDKIHVCDFFEDAPRLHDVEISGGNRLRCLLPWSQIDTWRQLEPSPDAAFSVLAFSEKLASLRLDICTLEDSRLLPERALSNLVKLELRFTEQNDSTRSLFERLSLPALISFSVRNPPPGLILSFINMLRRLPTSAMLESLCIYEYADYSVLLLPHEFAGLLALTPRLKTLTTFLPRDIDAKSFLQALVLEPHSSLVPLLESFAIYVDVVQDYTAVIRDIVVSRFCGSAEDDKLVDSTTLSLKSFQLRFSSYDLCWRDLEVLEEIFSTGKRSDDLDKNIILQLETWRDSFHATACALEEWSEMNAWFSDMENFEITDVRYLYASGLHHWLKQLKVPAIEDSTIVLRSIPFNLLERAQSLLDKWELLLLEDLPNRFWRLDPVDATITYVGRTNGTV
ncbi:hypothetical protein BDZ97DRAFT_1869370 [Flammula alnicola]|nr:hypothetical protein BDZ97DRAFT_1869370 [Flammula alnicola]